jgi:hypothetical protein
MDKTKTFFGRWPDFQDDEVLSITLDRTSEGIGSTVRIAVHTSR